MSTPSHVTTLNSGLENVRPGRNIFVRNVKLGNALVESSMNILLAHGSCVDSTQYDALLESLSTQVSRSHSSIHCCLYDAFACGKSRLGQRADFKAYSFEQDVLDFTAIYESMNQKRNQPTVLIAHSFRPSVILRFLLQNPQVQISGLVFLSSAIKGGPVEVHDGGHPIFLLPLFLLN